MTSGLPHRFQTVSQRFLHFARERPFKKLIKLILCRQILYLFLFIFTAAAACPFAPRLAGYTLHFTLAAVLQRCPGTFAASLSHTHTLSHTLLHRLVNIINRLAWQEACAAAAQQAGAGGGGGEDAGGVAERVRDLAYLIIMRRAFSCSAAMTLTLMMIILIRIRLMGQTIPRPRPTHRRLRATAPGSASAFPFRSEWLMAFVARRCCCCLVRVQAYTRTDTHTHISPCSFHVVLHFFVYGPSSGTAS